MPTKLASLTLHGYKTFAQKTNFDFPARITAIVGPNGSGKSNVADAIRWVLGEQSYSLLRAKKTEDMIYNGSDQRARAGMASVSITFDNEDNWLPIDYSEVVLTRRAYRDGANEYLLNNQRVRLKDFYELLAKTGLSERTYTIIGQGLVDLALSIRPDERSKLFEEAAGIGLYRSRKEEALKRLEVTQRNLERAQDILNEIKPRLRSLEKQAARAREFLALQENLQDKLRLWYGYYWYKAQKDLAAVKAQYESAQAACTTIQIQMESKHAEAEALKEQINRESEGLNVLRAEIAALQQQIQANVQSKAILAERERSLNFTKSQLELDLANLEEALQASQSSLNEAEAEIERKNQELVQLQEQFAQVEAQLEELRDKKKILDEHSAHKQSQILAAEKEAVVIKSRKEEITERISALETSIAANQALMANMQKEEDTAAQAHNALLEKQHALESEFQKLEEQHKVLQEKQAEVKRAMEQTSGQINRLNMERNKLSNQLDLLRQSQESLLGFSEGAKAILKNPRFQGKSKGFTDLATKLEVPEKYEKAITAALGEAIDLLVMEDGALDQALLNEISSSINDKVALAGAERASSGRPAAIPQSDAFDSVAADLIRYPERLAAVVQRLLGDFLVVSSLESIFSLPENIRENYNLVTLDGQVLLKNGVALVGKQRPSGKVSAIRRSKELEAALADVDASLIEARQIAENYRQELDQFETQLAQNQAQLRQVNTQAEQLRREVNNSALNLEKISNREKWIKGQIQDSNQQINNLKAEEAALTEKESKNQADIAALHTELETVRMQQTELSLEDIERQFQYLQMEIRIAQQAIEHAMASQKTQQQRLTSDHQYLEQLIVRKVEALKALDDLLAQKTEIDQATAELERQISALNAEQIDARQQQLNQLEDQYQQLLAQEEELRKELSADERQLTHFQLELSRRQERVDSLRYRIENDFGLIQLDYQTETISPTPLPFQDLSLESLSASPVPPDTTEVEIKELKAQLRRIGVVNVEAEQEYQETKARYDNLTSQIADLEAAIGDLQRIVKELDEVMEREFLATFKAVSAEFSSIFTRLFNGGSARLILSDKNSPLEGGIEIEARLPGKREQGLVLLSGGERSLTAVALVFALLKISPTPFCILDEVDAMMDESNVGRFIDLIKDLSKDTQFLLITHNRNTVQAADVIYGVTMGKDGASQVMSLQLEEVDEVYLK